MRRPYSLLAPCIIGLGLGLGSLPAAADDGGHDVEVNAGLRAANDQSMPLTLVLSTTVSNIAMPNDQAKFELTGNSIQQTIGLSYSRPISTPLFDTFSVRGDYLRDEITQQATSPETYRVYGISANGCGKNNRLAYCIGLAVQSTRYDADSGLGYMADYLAAVGNSTTAFLIRSNARYDTLSGPRWLPVGGITAFNGEATLPGSQLHYALLDIQHTQFIALGQRVRLKLRGDLGFLSSKDQPTPPNERFFGGASDNVRGYVYRGISPVDEVGQLMGANQKQIGSLELMVDAFHLGDIPFVLSSFYDAGRFRGATTPSLNSSAIARSWGEALTVPLNNAGLVSLSLAKPMSTTFEQQAFQIQVRVNW